MEKIVLDGREFLEVAQNLSASQDNYIISRIRRCGAMDILTDHDGSPKRTQEEKAEELLTRIMESGDFYFEILAGCLTERGSKWTAASADKNAKIFAEITDDAEKLLMRRSLTMFVAGFFLFGDRSSANSPKSLNPTGKVRRTKNAAA